MFDELRKVFEKETYLKYKQKKLPGNLISLRCVETSFLFKLENNKTQLYCTCNESKKWNVCFVLITQVIILHPSSLQVLFPVSNTSNQSVYLCLELKL